MNRIISLRSLVSLFVLSIPLSLSVAVSGSEIDSVTAEQFDPWGDAGRFSSGMRTIGDGTLAGYITSLSSVYHNRDFVGILGKVSKSTVQYRKPSIPYTIISVEVIRSTSPRLPNPVRLFSNNALFERDGDVVTYTIESVNLRHIVGDTIVAILSPPPISLSRLAFGEEFFRQKLYNVFYSGLVEMPDSPDSDILWQESFTINEFSPVVFLQSGERSKLVDRSDLYSRSLKSENTSVSLIFDLMEKYFNESAR